jgi:periplasmic protein TonB
MMLRVIAFAIIELLLPDSAKDVYRVGGSVHAPSVIKKVEAGYTNEARSARIEGSVELNLIVADDGHAKNIEVEKSLDPGLDASAIAAVKQWVFKPGQRNGQSVNVFAHIQVTFHLNDK